MRWLSLRQSLRRSRALSQVACLLVFTLVSSSWVSLAHAQSYEQVVSEATKEFSMGNFVEARALFLQAHASNPNARTLRGLAKVEFELRNYLRCIEHVEAALRSEVRPLTQAMREDVEDLAERARAFVATVKFILLPESARLRIEGGSELVGSGELQLEVGRHVAVIEAPGFTAAREQIEVLSAQSREVRVSLVPLASVLPAAVAAHEVTTAEAPSKTDLRMQTIKRRRRWGWTLAAVALAAGVAVGLVFGLRDHERSSTPPKGGSSGIVLTFSEGAP